MRTLFIATTVAVLATACASSEPRDRHDRRYDSQRMQVFDAYTTDGSFVRVEQDRRNGDMFIVEPQSRSGERVVMVNPDTNSGAPLVEVVRPDSRHEDGRDDDHRADRDSDHDRR